MTRKMTSASSNHLPKTSTEPAMNIIRMIAETTRHPFWVNANEFGSPVYLENSMDFLRIKEYGKILSGPSKPSVRECCRIVSSIVENIEIECYGLQINYIEGIIVENGNITFHAWLKHNSHHIDPITDELHVMTRGRRWAENKQYISLVELKKDELPDSRKRFPLLPAIWGNETLSTDAYSFENHTPKEIITRFSQNLEPTSQTPDGRKGIWLVE